MLTIAKNDILVYEDKIGSIRGTTVDDTTFLFWDDVAKMLHLENDIFADIRNSINLTACLLEETGDSIYLVPKSEINVLVKRAEEELAAFVVTRKKLTETIPEWLNLTAVPKLTYQAKQKAKEDALHTQIKTMEGIIAQLSAQIKKLENAPSEPSTQKEQSSLRNIRKPGCSYDDTFKKTVLSYYAETGNIKGTARHFGISRNTLRKYLRQEKAQVISVTKKELEQEKSSSKFKGEALLSSDVTDEDIAKQWRAWSRGMIAKIAFKIHEGDSMLTEENIRRIIWGQLYDKLSREFKINFKNERAHLRVTNPRAAYLDVLEKKNDPEVIKVMLDDIKRRADANGVNYEVVGLKKTA